MNLFRLSLYTGNSETEATEATIDSAAQTADQLPGQSSQIFSQSKKYFIVRESSYWHQQCYFLSSLYN
ncbi:MAG TPA: hypothetical protein VNI60_06620 [Pyrinomonadaceae bacterium]|nr:hypothetical protein [Pyrinomonadaceae bacterium]